MRIREITETKWASNTDLGIGSERVQDQRLLEKPRTKRKRQEQPLRDHLVGVVSIGTGTAGGNWGNSKI